MLLYELDQSDLATGYYDPAADAIGTIKPTDTRKGVLTLKHLNRLKKMRAVQKLENLKREDLLSIMYGQADAAAGGPPGF